MNKIGVILNNIGSPSSPEPEDVGNYLKEFLMDKEILTLPYILRYILVHFIIVPRRKYFSAEKYKKIWGLKKSPLIEISEDFCAGVQRELGENYNVQLGMVNGQPSIEKALDNLKESGVGQIIFAPLYPQYAKATTYAATQKTKAKLKKVFGEYDNLKVLKPFYNHPGFIELSAKKLMKEWDSGQWQHIMFSFHGLPEAQIKKNQGCLTNLNCCQRANACEINCYRAQSIKTAELIAESANLKTNQYTICFQSRLGPAKWIGPSSIGVVQQLAQKGYKKLLVQTPSFVADCLETLEEVAIELKSEFKLHGGDDLKLVDCLNQDLSWVQKFTVLIQELK